MNNESPRKQCSNFGPEAVKMFDELTKVMGKTEVESMMLVGYVKMKAERKNLLPTYDAQTALTSLGLK